MIHLLMEVLGLDKEEGEYATRREKLSESNSSREALVDLNPAQNWSKHIF